MISSERRKRARLSGKAGDCKQLGDTYQAWITNMSTRHLVSLFGVRQLFPLYSWEVKRDLRENKTNMGTFK